jgi:hypothetical protein
MLLNSSSKLPVNSSRHKGRFHRHYPWLELLIKPQQTFNQLPKNATP